MLTGRVAFPGETLSDVIVAILDRSPDWSAVPAGTPADGDYGCCAGASRRTRANDCETSATRGSIWRTRRARADARLAAGGARLPIRNVEFQRLTDVEGLKEAPAVSPDGKMVAFVAMVAGKRQIWIRLLAGGAALQLTRDDADHTHPRWAPDSSTLIYFTPAATESDVGTVWEIGALGGWPRRIATAIGAADISHDGQRIAMLQSSEDQLALVVASRDGSRGNRVVFLPTGSYSNVRWAPDDRSIAYQRLAHTAFDGHLEVASLATGERHEVARGTWLQGFAWLPDGSGFVYSSSRGSTLLYPPVFNLRAVRRDGSDDRQLTFGDHSYVEPDVHASGKLIAGRTTSRSDIWKIPDRWLAAREHDERCSDNPPDRSGSGAVGRAPMTGRLCSCRTPAGTRTCGSPEPTGPPRVRSPLKRTPMPPLASPCGRRAVT